MVDIYIYKYKYPPTSSIDGLLMVNLLKGCKSSQHVLTYAAMHIKVQQVNSKRLNDAILLKLNGYFCTD